MTDPPAPGISQRNKCLIHLHDWFDSGLRLARWNEENLQFQKLMYCRACGYKDLWRVK
jgi:hypothetical protein